jgi:4-amino-4-deoxy-L-arabinose transferase-like glycosyltransferase
MLSLLVIGICSCPIFIDLGRHSIELWDESLNAINAIEMSRDGDFIVRHYCGEPDMWNTKPPLVIWLQVLSMRAFGYSEFALRLPSALCAVCTIVILIVFSHMEFRNLTLGYFSSIVLVTSRGYIGKHVSRTGDNDVFLVFFLVVSVLYFYKYVEHEDKKRVHILIATLSLTCAALTKGVACLIFLPGMLAYAFYRARVREILASSTIYYAILMFLMIVAGYYVLREHYNPGYLRAVWTNEVAARYISSPQLEHHPGGFLYYAKDLAMRQFSSWLFFVPVGCALIFFNTSSPMKPFAALLLFCTAFAFIIISFAKTKMQWYAAPLLPLLSIIVGAGLSDIYAYIRKALALHNRSARIVLGACFVVAIFLLPYARTINSIRNEADDASALYGDFMKKIANSKSRPGSFSVMHQGWSPYIYYYAQQLAETKDIAITRKFSPAQLRVGEVVVTCQNGNLEWIREHFDCEVLDSYKECSMIRIRGIKTGESGESPRP